MGEGSPSATRRRRPGYGVRPHRDALIRRQRLHGQRPRSAARLAPVWQSPVRQTVTALTRPPRGVMAEAGALPVLRGRQGRRKAEPDARRRDSDAGFAAVLRLPGTERSPLTSRSRSPLPAPDGPTRANFEALARARIASTSRRTGGLARLRHGRASAAASPPPGPYLGGEAGRSGPAADGPSAPTAGRSAQCRSRSRP